MIIIEEFLLILLYVLAGLFLFIIGKVFYSLFNPKINVTHELVEADNDAFSFAYVGYFFGLVIALGSTLSGESEGLVADLWTIGSYGLIAIVLLNISQFINNKIILSKFDLRHEIVDNQSISSGIIQGANSIATGMIVLGAISGDGYGVGGPYVNSTIYWALGMVLLFITSKVYDYITPYSFQEHAAKGNIAVSIGYAGAMISIANLIKNALTHDFISWEITLQDVAFEVTIGLIFLPITRLFSDKILLPSRNLTDELIHQEKPNVGAALVEGFAYVGGSMLIVWAI